MTTHTVARILGVHDSTVKRLSASGKLVGYRTKGGHLRTDAEQVAAYLWQQEEGHPLHRVREELVGYLRGLQLHFEQNDDDLLIEVLLGCLIVGHEEAFHSMVGHLFTIYPEDVLVLGPILLRLLRMIETRHAKLEMSIADEHRSAQIIRDTIVRYHFAAKAVFRPNGKEAIVGCARADAHDISALLVRSVFMLRGYTVRYLGANVPNEEFTREQERWKADFVCICRTMPSEPGEDQQLLRSLMASLDRKRSYRLILGGDWSAWCEPVAQRHDKIHIVNTLKGLDDLLRASA